MALPCNVHRILDPFVGYCRHDYPPSPFSYSFIDFGVVHGFTGLFAWSTAAFSYPPAKKPGRGEIFAKGLPMEAGGTDATLMVPHVPVPPMLSWELPLLILFGSSTIIMSSSKTRIWCKGLVMTGESEEAAGCCVFPYIPMSLNLQCWDLRSKGAEEGIGAPMMSDIVIAYNTVQVGTSFGDYSAMIVAWATEVITAVLMAGGSKQFKKLKKSKAPKLSKKALARANRAADKAESKALKKALAKGMSKEAAEASAKAARKAAFDHASKSVLKEYGKAAGKAAWKVVKNTEWYRDTQAKMKQDVKDVL